MDLMRLLRTNLLCLCEELGVEVEQKMKKSEISKAISESAEAEEIKIALELEIEQQRLNSQNSRVGAPVRASETESYQMKKLMQPFKVGENVGLFLVNFERTCEKLSFAPETWPQRLLTLLPCEDAETRTSLLKRYRLSAEAFRQRFRNASKKSSEGYSEFAYGLKTNLIEWLKSEEVYESRDKVVECVCLEQFFRSIPQSVKLWVQDRVGVDSVERAAELAEEYATRRKLSGEESEPGRSDQRKTFRQGNGSRENGPEKPEAGQKVPEKSAEHSNGDEARKSPAGQFEARKPFLCYNCQEPGHTAARCKKPRVVFSYVNGSDKDLKLLRPYLHELQVNGKPCRVLRDSAATMDVVHPSYVTPSEFTGKVVWIKQLLEKHSVCLPMATVRITGPFGELVTQAAVSQTVPLEYHYLFSNRSDFLLRERGQQLGEGLVQSCTRSKSRQVAPLLTSDPEPEAADGEQALPELEEENRDERDQVVEQPDLVALGSVRRPNAPAEKAEEEGISERSLVAPASCNFGPLLRVDRVSLTVEQKSDPSVSGFRGTAQEIARINVTGQEKGGLFYRRYKDRIFTRLFLDVLGAAGNNPHVAFGLKLLKEGKLSEDEAEHFLSRLPLNLKEHSPALITQLAFVEGLNHLAAFEYDDSDIGSVDTKESGALRFFLLFSSMAFMRYEDIEQIYEQNVVNAPEPNRKNVRRLFLDVLGAAGNNPHVAFGLKLLKEGKLSEDEAEHFLSRLPLNLKEHSPALITQLAEICRSQLVRSQRQVWVNCILTLSTIAGQHGCVRGKTEDEPDKGTCSATLISQFFNTRNIALPVYENKSERAVIRIAAFRCILNTKPNLSKLRHMARYVIDDPSDQVASYVTSTFRALLESKYPCHQELAQHLRYVMPMWDNVQRFSKPLDYTQSQLALSSGYDPEYDYGGATIFSMIRADDSYLPRSFYFKAKDYYAGYSYDTVAMSFEGWGMNKLLDGSRGTTARLRQEPLELRRATSVHQGGVGQGPQGDRGRGEDIRKLHLPIQDWPFDPVYARIGLSMYGNEIDTWEFDESILGEMKESDKAGHGPWDILTKQVRRKSFFLNNDYIILVPTDMGVPVFMDFKSVDFAFIDRQKFDFAHTADDKISLDVKRRYVYENRGFSVVGVALTFNETAVGSGSDSRTVLSLPLEFKVTLDTVNHKLHLQRPLAFPWNILNHHNRPSTFALPFDLTRDIGNAVIQLADPQTPLYNKYELTEIGRGFRTDSLPIGLNVEGSVLSKGLSEGLHKFWYEMDWRQKFYYAVMNPHWHPRELRLTLVEAEKNVPTTIELDLSHKFFRPEDARESKFPVHDAIDGDPESPSTHVLNAELNFRGGKKDRKIATELRYSYTSDTFKHKMQFFYDRATSQQKKEHIKICLDSTLKFPAPEWSRLKNLATFHEGKEIDSSLNIRYGTSCEGQSSITFNGKFTHTDDDAQQIRENAEAKPRSPDRLRPFYLRDMYAKCVHHQKLGVPLNYYCVKYMYYSSRLGKLTTDIEYKKLKPLLPGVHSHVSKYHSHSEDHLGFFGVIGEHMDGPTGKLRVVSQVPPRKKYADVMVSTADGRHFFHPHVPLYSHILEPRVFVAFGYTNIAEYTTYYKQKYCDLQGSSVRTFDGVIVKLPETNCFKVVSRDCTPDNKRFLILARSTGNPALPKALKMFIHNTKIEILQIAADAGLVVRVDGSRVEVPQAVPYSHMSHGAELFKIKLKSKFYLVESSSYGLSVGFDGKVLTVQTASFYRGSLCGLCADNNYDRLNELVGPDRHVHNDTLEFAKSYVVPYSDCTPP
ncbi:hypothetical protein HPB47_009287 [Ixodes persulcatus]|uniref:Uncharacterized protein n=1 Tax=Ixodes persulcatus TaxID=34615 RepID=A0AC60P2E0_IXOPE|nr:hypothetical protein HPB47_009287 [Ixodes persulcatus]